MAEIQFNGKEWEVADALQAFYTPYASYVIQTRALPDARDGLKKGTRFILYSQFKNKLTKNEKRRKAAETVSAAMRFSPHGDASIYGTAIRLSQDFSMRYPVIEVHGNNGSVLSGDDYSQPRYLEMRSNEIAWEMTELLSKETIDEWKLNYTEEEQYPVVLPSKFPFALTNGSFGIGVACSSSIPPHNLIDVCNAAIKVLNNPEVDFEEIYCPIDFPTGGTIINEAEVKESLKNGTGKAALVRATVEYDEKENELIVTEIPYMTYTSTIIKSISKALEQGVLTGIEGVTDGTEFSGCKIYIQLTKGANVERVLKRLYKHTELQTSYSINMNMLENGKVPKLFTWKESVETYVNHLKNIIQKAYQFDLKKAKERLVIVDGLLIAQANLEKVIQTIRSMRTSGAAKDNLMLKFGLVEEQADAILKMRLSSLTNLEVEKLEKEKENLDGVVSKIEQILSTEENFKKAVEKEIERIKTTYGDERRTKQLSLDFTSEDDDAEPIEKKELLLYCTNQNNIYAVESSTLLKTRRGGKGSKIKLEKNEVVTKIINDNNLSSLLIFSNKGAMYELPIVDLPIDGKMNIKQAFHFDNGEFPTTITSVSKQLPKYFIFVTKQGMIKKSLAEDYVLKRGNSLKAISLKDDEVVNVLFADEQDVGLLTNKGVFLRFKTDGINPIGRVAAGVKSIKLEDGDWVIDAHLIEQTDKLMLTLSKNGLVKKCSMEDYPSAGRTTKGKQISGTKNGDNIIKFLTIENDCDIIIPTQKQNIKISTKEVRALSRYAMGVKAITLGENEVAIDLIRS